MNSSKREKIVDWNFVLQYPFSYKLYFLTNIEYIKFLKWSDDGKSMIVDSFALQDYLQSTASIFKMKTFPLFLEHLKEFGFQQIYRPLDEPGDIHAQHFYRHDHFQRGRRDLLKLVRRKVPVYAACVPPKSKMEDKVTLKGILAGNEQRVGDLCFARQGTLSVLQFHRLTQLVHMKYETQAGCLASRLQYAENKMAKLGHPPRPEDNVDIRGDLYENPQQSALPKENENSEYAGFFGNATKSQLNAFFSTYLPKFEKNPNGTSKIVVNLPQRLNNAKQLQQQYQDSEFVDNDFENEEYDAELQKEIMDISNFDEDAAKNVTDPIATDGHKIVNEVPAKEVPTPVAKSAIESAVEQTAAPVATKAAATAVETNKKNEHKGYFFHDILKLKPVDASNDVVCIDDGEVKVSEDIFEGKTIETLEIEKMDIEYIDLC